MRVAPRMVRIIAGSRLEVKKSEAMPRPEESRPSTFNVRASMILRVEGITGLLLTDNAGLYQPRFSGLNTNQALPFCIPIIPTKADSA